MSLYAILKFLHVSGDIGLFIGIGLWLAALIALRRTEQVAQVRILTQLMTLYEPVSIISGLLTIATGLYMAWSSWGFQHGWITVTLGSLIVLLPPAFRVVIQPRLDVITKLARELPDGPLSPALVASIHDPLLGTTVQTVAAVVLGIVFMMTTKSSFTGSLIAMAVALALGVASGLPLWRAARLKRA